MSCFIMRTESIYTLGNTLESVFNAALHSFSCTIATDACPNALLDAFADCVRCQSFDGVQIADVLYRINAMAYAGRYKKPVDDELPPCPDGAGRSLYARPVIEIHRERPQDWHYHFAALLDCWLYQTNEDATRDDIRRTMLSDFARNLKCLLVTHSMQYSKHPWGC